MKTRLLILFLFCCAFSYSQNQEKNISKESEPYVNHWLFQTSLGTNIDLIRPATHPNAALLGTRSDVAPVWGMRLAHLFSRRIGWYADLQMSFYKENRDGSAEAGVPGHNFDDFMEALFWPVSTVRPSVNGGIMYRIESTRWRIYPSLGLGYSAYQPDRKKTGSWQDDDKQRIDYIYKQHASSLIFNAGVSVDYLFSDRFFVVLNADFQQPLQRSYAYLTTTTQENEVNRMAYSTTTAGRILNISVGVGLVFGR